MTLPPLSPNAWLRFDLIQRLLPAEAHRVLEVGCGQGSLGARLAATGRDYLGLEPDPSSYAVAIRRLAAVGRGEVRNQPLEELDPAASFDLVCAFEVIEHIQDDRAALAAWVAHVRPGGWLLLSTPADPERFAAADEIAGHFRRYRPAELAELLQVAGLTGVVVRRYGAPLGYLLQAGRNAVAARRLNRATSMADRSGASGRFLQPSSVVQGTATELLTAPFRLLQRALPDRGPGLVALGRRPD